jgi:hypothetical protein
MLDRDGWRDCAEIMDMRVWVECDREVCRQRTIKRNFAAGIVDSIKKCEERGESRFCDGEAVVLILVVDASDAVNGDEVADHQYKPTTIISSIDASQLVEKQS